MRDEAKPVVVIGGGGAGILAAWSAATRRAPVVLLERNRKIGIKLLISGGGKCNITHAGSMEELGKAFAPTESRFLRPAFYRFSNDDVVRMLENRGVATHVRPNGRIFPARGTAREVVGGLVSYLRQAGVQVELESRALSIVTESGHVAGVSTESRFFPSHQVIIATGGLSYPRTGTTGDGYRMAAEVGHSIVPLRPALAPIAVTPPLPAEWRGIPLRGGSLSLHVRGKKIASWRDDILLTHEGLSGPAALELSGAAAKACERDSVSVKFDFFPGTEFGDIDEKLTASLLIQRGKMVATLLESWLPNRMVPTMLRSAGVEPTKRGYLLTREERRTITRLLKSWLIGTVSHVSLERGEVTAGGVSLAEVDPHTMQSRKIPGLYLCGEVLDIAGPIGGYNLQAAFSTGFVAGNSAAADWHSARFEAPARESTVQQ